MKGFNWAKLAVMALLLNESAAYAAVASADYLDGAFRSGSLWCALTAALYFVTVVLVFFRWRQTNVYYIGVDPAK